MSDAHVRNHAAFISWLRTSRAALQAVRIRRVILPLVVLRRLDCVLAPTKVAVPRDEALPGRVENVAPVLDAVAGELFYNTSPLDFRRLLDDPANVVANLRAYIAGALLPMCAACSTSSVSIRTGRGQLC